MLCAAFAVACAAPGNRVVGGVLGSGSVPDAMIPTVRSAISGDAVVVDVNGNRTERRVVLLSNEPGLCAMLGAHPDLFESAPQGFVILALLFPRGSVGSIAVGPEGSEVDLFVSASAGSPIDVYLADSGSTSLDGLDGGAALALTGSFDVEITSSATTQVEVYGQFATEECAAIASAFIPRLPN